MKIRFDAPQPPTDFIPKFRLQSKNIQLSNNSSITTTTTAAVTSLNAEQRRDILGEEELKGPTRSVFSFIPLKEQDKLQSFLEKVTTGSGVAESKKELKEILPQVDLVDKATAAAALKGFIPFGNDPAKQERYKIFLEIKASGETSEFVLKHPPVSILFNLNISSS